MPWLFLLVTLVGACFTFNAYIPQRSRFIVPSFFAGWLTSELSAHHFAWQLAATVLFVWAGALSAWPGWVGLGITLASWAGLLALVPLSWKTRGVVEQALVEGLGGDYAEALAPQVAERVARGPGPSRHLLPFLLFDPDVRRIDDVEYVPGQGRRGRLDLYLPRQGARRAPVLLQIHGGAWTISQKRHQALPLMLHLARAGWLCVAPNYRLSPRATFPDQLIDLKRALGWIRAHVARFGGDPDFVVATGGSAGGHLSALMALTANAPEYQPGFEQVDTRLRACVPFYGVYDFTNHQGQQLHDGLIPFLERVVMKKSIAEHREAFERASPMHRIHPDAPPFFVLHGTHDSLTPVEEARAFVQRLRQTSRAPVLYAELPGAQHAFEVFHSLRTSQVVHGVHRFLTWVYSRYLDEEIGAAPAPRGCESEAAADRCGSDAFRE